MDNLLEWILTGVPIIAFICVLYFEKKSLIKNVRKAYELYKNTGSFICKESQGSSDISKIEIKNNLLIITTKKEGTLELDVEKIKFSYVPSSHYSRMAMSIDNAIYRPIFNSTKINSFIVLFHYVKIDELFKMEEIEYSDIKEILSKYRCVPQKAVSKLEDVLKNK